MRKIVECPNCFHQVRIDPDVSADVTKCLKCGQQFSVAEDQAAAYGLGVRPCPKCDKDCAPDAVICIECGYDFQTHKKHRMRHEPFHASWQSALSFGTRWLIFGIVAMLLVAAFLLGWRPGMLVWGLGTVGAGLILGTFHRISLSRSSEGKVVLRTKRWICFYPWADRAFNLKHYKHVALGYSSTRQEDSSRILAAFDDDDDYGGESYSLSIVRVDGESTMIYQGLDEHEVRQMADTICRVAGLRYG